MEIRSYLASICRLPLEVFLGGRSRKYAIQVDAGYVESFDIAGTKACDSWENADGSAVFIVQSRKDLRYLAQSMKGVRAVSLM